MQLTPDDFAKFWMALSQAVLSFTSSQVTSKVQ